MWEASVDVLSKWERTSLISSLKLPCSHLWPSVNSLTPSADVIATHTAQEHGIYTYTHSLWPHPPSFFNLHMYVIHSFFSKGNRSPSGPLVHITNDSPNFTLPPQRFSDSLLDSSIIISPCTRWPDVFNAVVYSANPLRSRQSEQYRCGIRSHRSRIRLSGLLECYIHTDWLMKLTIVLCVLNLCCMNRTGMDN